MTPRSLWPLWLLFWLCVAALIFAIGMYTQHHG